MRNMFLILLTHLIILAVSSPVLADNFPEGTLGRAELIEMFHDHTVESVTLHKGRVSLSYYSPTGEVRQLREGKRRYGFWRVRDDGRICLRMEENAENCRIVVREKDGSLRKYVVKKDGNHQPVVGYRKFVEGNPQNL